MHLFVLILGLILILLPDLWIYTRVRSKISNKFLRILFCLPTLGFVIFFFMLRFKADELSNYKSTAQIMWGFFAFFVLYIPKINYVLFDLIHRMCKQKFKLNRSPLQMIGLSLSLITILLLIHGATIGKDRLKVTERTITFNNFPEMLNGLKVVQISDLHLGNWNDNTKTIARMVELVNEQNPDIIICSGDVVNNFADELPLFIPILQKLNAKYGKFAVLGNHDYGDYSKWNSVEERAENLAEIKNGIRKCGFNLLLNEHEIIEIKGEKLKISGVENWGVPPFKQYGKLAESLGKSAAKVFTILISHDSSHFMGEVIQYPEVNLTLSGHTHAAQFGIFTENFQWSPSKWKYEHYAGLYQHGEQYLYVNRGIGFVGVPMRIGATPEITVLTLEHQK